MTLRAIATASAASRSAAWMACSSPASILFCTWVRDEPKTGSVRLRLIGLRKGRSDFDVPWHARSNGTFCSLWGPVVFKTNIFARSTRPPDTVTDYSQYQNPKNVFGRLRSLHKSPAQERRCPWYTYVTLYSPMCTAVYPYAAHTPSATGTEQHTVP